MGELDDFDLDRSTMRAWGRFQSELADHIVAMDDDDIVIVEVESSLDENADGAAPYVQFCAWGEDLVRAEVSSNAYLAADVALDRAGTATLVRGGWSAPTYGAADEPDTGSANFYLDAQRREGDRLAAMTVAALREVFGVPHPAFLTWPGSPPGDDASGPGPDDESLSPGRGDEPLAVMPGSSQHLRDLVAAALTPPAGPAIEFDEDGDIPLPMGSALVFVRVVESAPVVELFAFVVRGIEDTERAAFEVGVLNRDTRMIKFVLLDDAVLATLQLPAAPFAPSNLRTVVLSMADVIDRIDDDLVARVGGRRGLEPEPEDDEAGADDADDGEEYDDERDERPEQPGLHPALLTLLHLDPDGDGGTDPELAASVCDFDRDLVLVLLREASEQEITWRKSGNLALIGDDSDEATACLHEARGWEATVETLRAALRVIVERERAEAEVFRRRREEDARASAPRRPRRGRRAVIQEGLIDDAAVRRDATGQDVLFDPEPGADERPEAI